MDWTSIGSMIGSLGFPIVACVAMFYMYNNIITQLMTTLTKIDSTLDNICEKLNLEKED